MAGTKLSRTTRLEILEFMRAYRSEAGFFPTQTEIGDSLGISNTTLRWHLGSLVDQGFLTYNRRDFARTVRLTRKNLEVLE